MGKTTGRGHFLKFLPKPPTTTAPNLTNTSSRLKTKFANSMLGMKQVFLIYKMEQPHRVIYFQTIPSLKSLKNGQPTAMFHKGKTTISRHSTTTITTAPITGKTEIFRGTTSKKPKTAAPKEKFPCTETWTIGGWWTTKGIFIPKQAPTLLEWKLGPRPLPLLERWSQ